MTAPIHGVKEYILTRVDLLPDQNTGLTYKRRPVTEAKKMRSRIVVEGDIITLKSTRGYWLVEKINEINSPKEEKKE